MNSGRVAAQVFLDARPGGDEIRVGRAGQHRQVELGAHGGTGASLACGAGPRIKVPAVLVYVGEQQVRVGFVGVENPVAMVGVDVDVSDAADAVAPSQHLDDDATVIEYAEPGRVRARRMMQSPDADECALDAALHQLFGREQRAADHQARGFEHTAEGGSVAGIEIASTVDRALYDQVHVRAVVEVLDLLALSDARRQHLEAAVRRALLELAQKRFLPVRTKRMTVGKAVPAQRIRSDERNRGHTRTRGTTRGGIAGETSTGSPAWRPDRPCPIIAPLFRVRPRAPGRRGPWLNSSTP